MGFLGFFVWDPGFLHHCSPLPIHLSQVLLALSKAVESDPDVGRSVAQSIEESNQGDGVRRHLSQALRQATDVTLQSEAPTTQQLRFVGIAASIPFIGFGILDNMLMILCGDWIDTTLCVTLGFSTMAAAALGNTISDAAGVYSGGMVEDWAAKWGIEAPKLSRTQEALPITKSWERFGQLLGVVLGCIIGMFPLLFIDSRKAEKMKQVRRMDDLYHTVLEAVSDMLDAEAAMLMLVDPDEDELFTRAAEGIPEFRSPIGEGVKGAVAKEGKFINIEDVRTTSYYKPERHDSYQGSGVAVKSVLCMPIIGPAGVLGVVEVINKQGYSGFTEKDEDVLSAMCSHISTAICSVDGSENAFKQTLELCEKSLNCTRLNAAQNTRIDALFNSIIAEVIKGLDVQAAQLLILDRELGQLKTKSSLNVPSFITPINQGIMGRVVQSKDTLCINDVRASEYYDKERHENYRGTGMEVRKVMCLPILDVSHEVIGVIEVINKNRGNFTTHDVAFLNAVASHLAFDMQGPGTSLKSILKMMAVQKPTQEMLFEEAEEISKESLRKLLGSAFVEVDVNGDGVIDKEEFEAAALQVLERQLTKKKRYAQLGH